MAQMATNSRRLAISSLLCNDIPADDIRSSSSQNMLPTFSESSPSSVSSGSSKERIMPAKPHYCNKNSHLSTSPRTTMSLSGLEALVHVATEERSRIDINDSRFVSANQGSSVQTVKHQFSPLSIMEQRQGSSISSQSYIQPVVPKSFNNDLKKGQRLTPNIDADTEGIVEITLPSENSNVSSFHHLRDSRSVVQDTQSGTRSPSSYLSSLQSVQSVSDNKSIDLLDRETAQSTVSSSGFAALNAAPLSRSDEGRGNHASKMFHRSVEEPDFWQNKFTGGNVYNERQYSAGKQTEEAEEDVHDFFLSAVTSADANLEQVISGNQSIASERETNDTSRETQLSKHEESISAKLVTVSREDDSSPNVFQCAVPETELYSVVSPISNEQGRITTEMLLKKSTPGSTRISVDTEDKIYAGISGLSDADSRDSDVDDEILKLLNDDPGDLQHDSQWLSTSKADPLDKLKTNNERDYRAVTTQRAEIDTIDTIKRDGIVAPEHTPKRSLKMTTTSKDSNKNVPKYRSKKPRGDSKKPRISKTLNQDGGLEELQSVYKANDLTFSTSGPTKIAGNTELLPTTFSSGSAVTESRKPVTADEGLKLNIKPRSSSGLSSTQFLVRNGARSSAMKRTAAKANSSRSRSHSMLYQNNTYSDSPKNYVSNVDKAEASIEGYKLYCICQTVYDEDRVMIACDRCDEWYHTQCVNMSDLDVDLVDQFICLICIKQNPSLHLQTTYKQRCHAGLANFDPSSPGACHKPARGAFSKYCSDECGVMYMQTKIQNWIHKDGDINHLRTRLRGAKKREGVVTSSNIFKQLENIESNATDPREVFRLHNLQTRLDRIIRDREVRYHEKEIISRRQELLKKATFRASSLEDECGWDERLCFRDDEWDELGEEASKSYDNILLEKSEENLFEHEHIEGTWWCRGKKNCDRHFGWQKLKLAETEFDRDLNDNAISSLNRQEREIRKNLLFDQ